MLPAIHSGTVRLCPHMREVNAQIPRTDDRYRRNGDQFLGTRTTRYAPSHCRIWECVGVRFNLFRTTLMVLPEVKLSDSTGFCQHGTLIRNTRHHAIRELIAKSLPFFCEVHQEVHCLAKYGSSRRVDIIAIDRGNTTAIIIDPTVRFEIAVEQPIAVHEEKKTIYDPTIEYFRDYYHIQGQTEVFGLLFGARGTIPQFSVECFGIPLNILKIIAVDVMKYSVQILRNHLHI
ncbi:hypothetical protein ANN_14408 [Periplaneta americana]|uniref:Uncharacterized protein n=1 Tax=Periplaneta americana TaxID=6978 RepID=A0ABQ8SW83_PERAM|nr:hypothetical protein ANN_14408 [Periplaneta americana]